MGKLLFPDWNNLSVEQRINIIRVNSIFAIGFSAFICVFWLSIVYASPLMMGISFTYLGVFVVWMVLKYRSIQYPVSRIVKEAKVELDSRIESNVKKKKEVVVPKEEQPVEEKEEVVVPKEEMPLEEEQSEGKEESAREKEVEQKGLLDT